jgi:hypothetical protein
MNENVILVDGISFTEEKIKNLLAFAREKEKDLNEIIQAVKTLETVTKSDTIFENQDSKLVSGEAL